MEVCHNCSCASNRSDEQPWPPLICSCIMMSCCVIGLPGNLISALIFFRLTSRSPINVLLMTLSIIDFCLLLVSTPIMVLPSLNVYLEMDWIFKIYPYILITCYPLSALCQSISMFTFVLITTERYMAVCRIFELRHLITTSRTKWAQMAVILFAVLINVVRFFEYSLDEDSDEGYRRQLREDYVYFTLYHLVFHLITHFIIPFSLIAFLGANILKTMTRKGTYMENSSMGPDRRQASQRRTTSMICVVTSMFVVCNCLPFLINIWEVIDFDLFTGPYRFVAFPLIDIANTLVFINSATTFLFYWIYCQKYRRILKSGIRRLFGFCYPIIPMGSHVPVSCQSSSFGGYHLAPTTTPPRSSIDLVGNRHNYPRRSPDQGISHESINLDTFHT